MKADDRNTKQKIKNKQQRNYVTVLQKMGHIVYV